MMSDYSIVSISIWDSFCIHFNAVLLGIWVVLKRSIRWAWNPHTFFSIQVRDNPPACLVDTSLGHHSYVKFKGIKLHYVESGQKHQPLVLLLHGFPDCWLSWRYQIPELAKNFRVVAVDLKGFGDSDKPPWRHAYRVDTILAELRHFIHSLGVKSCIVIGHDLGALLGWYLAHKSPDLIKKFVAVSSPHPNIYWDYLNDASAFNTSWMQVTQLPYLPEIDAMKEDLNIINQCYKHIAPPKNGRDDYLEAYKYTFSRTEDWTGPLNYYRNLPFTRINAKACQSEVHTLLVMGNKDPLVRLEGVVRSTDFCEKFVVKIVENAGHFPHQERPDVFNKMVLDFIAVRGDSKCADRTATKGIMDRMFGAVTNTVKYGNTMLDAVHKTTNGVVGAAPRALFLTQNQ